MKIAVSATGSGLKADVEPRFGRAKYFLIIDMQSERVLKVIDNSEGMNAPHGAGINAASLVAEAGAEAVLTGRVGPKAFAVFDAAGIKVYSGVSGTVKDALEKFKKGDLDFDKGPTSDGHAGFGAGFGRGRGGGGGMGRGRRGLGRGRRQ